MAGNNRKKSGMESVGDVVRGGVVGYGETVECCHCGVIFSSHRSDMLVDFVFSPIKITNAIPLSAN